MAIRPGIGPVEAETGVECTAQVQRERPVSDLQFRALSFRGTSWAGASGPEGYASQQSGSFLAGPVPGYPSANARAPQNVSARSVRSVTRNGPSILRS